ncbi:MAG: response regulator [Actinomycetota bacterium]
MTSDTPGESPGRILLIEDDPVAAHFMSHVLGARGGFDVVHTPDPGAALQLAVAQHWNLVLTDAELPGMTALTLLAELRRISPGLPVAVVTAHEAADPAVRDLRRQADGFLQKPVRPDQLREAVASLIAQGRAPQVPVPSAARAPALPVVLAIGAHPGDAEIGAAGALLTYRSSETKVSILTLCRGAADGAAGTRTGQPEMAALALGATLYLEDLPDGRIGQGDRAAEVISQVVASVQPTVIYTHSLHDHSQDHRDVHQAVLQAAAEVGRIYAFQSPSATIDFRPSRTVVIDRQLERKLLAVRAFPDQAEARDYLDRDLVQLTASYWSRFSDGSHAEAFEVIREDEPAAADGRPGAAVSARCGANRQADLSQGGSGPVDGRDRAVHQAGPPGQPAAGVTSRTQ